MADQAPSSNEKRLIETNTLAMPPGKQDPFFNVPPPIGKVRLLTLQENNKENQDLPWIWNRDPQTGGYKYVILLCAFLTLFVFSVTLSGSMYTSQLEKHFGINRSDSSVFSSLEFGIFCGCSLFVARIMDLVGTLPSLYVSLISICLGQLVPPYIETYWGMTVFYAIFMGIGAAGCQMIGMLMSNDWYEPLNRTGFSTGVSLAAVGAGGIGWTYYMQYFLDNHGWKVCMQYCSLLSAIISVIIIVLTRSRTIFDRKSKNIIVARVNQDVKELIGASNITGATEFNGTCVTPNIVGVDGKTKAVQSTTSNMSDVNNDAHNSSIVSFDPQSNHGNDVLYSPTPINPDDGVRTTKPLQDAPVVSSHLSTNLHPADFEVTSKDLFGPPPPFLYLSPLLNLRFVLFLIVVFLATFMFYAPYVHIINSGIEEGLNPTDAEFLLVIMGIANLCCRPLLGALADKSGGLIIILISNAMQMLGAIFWIYCDRLWMFNFLAVWMGVAGACYIIGCSYTPQRLVKPFEISSAMGFVFGIAFTPGATAMGPIMGDDFDNNGTYTASLTAFAVIQGFSVLLNIWIWLPVWNSPKEESPKVEDGHTNAQCSLEMVDLDHSTCATEDATPKKKLTKTPSREKLKRTSSSNNIDGNVYVEDSHLLYLYPNGKETFFRMYADQFIRSKTTDLI